jgi:hypothetical protein
MTTHTVKIDITRKMLRKKPIRRKQKWKKKSTPCKEIALLQASNEVCRCWAHYVKFYSAIPATHNI